MNGSMITTGASSSISPFPLSSGVIEILRSILFHTNTHNLTYIPNHSVRNLRYGRHKTLHTRQSDVTDLRLSDTDDSLARGFPSLLRAQDTVSLGREAMSGHAAERWEAKPETVKKKERKTCRG